MNRICNLLALALLVFTVGAARAAPVTVFAAASLKTALDEVAALSTEGAQISYAGSSALARQIEAGAPAQIFISANTAWMDRLGQEGLLARGTRRDLLTNRLVLIAAPGFASTVKIGPEMDLVAALNGGKLAMALVDSVPAGMYGREALESLGLWDRVHPFVAQADNVRAALRLVALGEAPLGIVYETDALAEPRVRVVDGFDPALHTPIRYPAAILTSGDTPEARDFFALLTSPAAQAIFERNGFGIVVAAP